MARLLHSPSRGRGEAGYRAGLSSRRPRVQVPSLPLFFFRATHWRALHGGAAAGTFVAPPRVHSQRAVAQLVARSVRDRKAGGSNPPSPTHVHVNFRTGLIYSPCHLKARAFRIPSKLTLCQALWRLTAGFSALARHLVDLLRNAAWQGFVWGGSWSVFDTMHFEYRPEILLMRASPGSCEQEEY